MEVVSFTDLGDAVWQEALKESDDAWFWHTRFYANFLLEINKPRGVRDASFALVDKSSVIAACPLYLDEVAGTPQLGCGDEPVPFPALANTLLQTAREKALERYFSELARLAKVHRAVSIRMRISPLVRNHIANPLRPFNPLVRHGFLDLPVSTQVIDLRLDEGALWTDVRKGHRYDIRRAEKVCDTVFWDQETITPEVFARYQQLHGKDAGRITRSQDSFDIMFTWIKAGHAVLAEATREGRSVAFALIVLFADGAFYGSGCKDPDSFDLNASHMLQWRAILWLKESGCKYYDMGLQYFGPQWAHVPSKKEMSISRYKRGFGGVTIPVHSGEFFYQPDVLNKVLGGRLEKLSQAYCSSVERAEAFGGGEAGGRMEKG
jgi:hypothetical protein